MLLIHLLAQAAAAATPEAVAAPTQGVISYPPAFFAAQQPNSALDMVSRIPGFSLDTGAQVRGFEGAAGNVLIDGQRPSSKTDNLESLLSRLPATRVERIDLIRGGAPGIDMQGKSVLVNVVRKSGGGVQGMIAGSQNHVYDGRTSGAYRAEASGGDGTRKWELSSRGGRGIDDGAGEGPGIRIFANGRPTVRSAIDAEGDGLNAQITGVYETPLFGGKARINGRIARDKFKYDEDNVLLTPVPGLEETDDLYRTNDTEVGGNFSRALTGRLNMEVVGLRQTRERMISSTFTEAADVSSFNLARESSETIGRAVLKHRWGDKLSFEAGGETALNQLESQTGFTVNGARIPLPAANVAVEEVRSEVFAKAAWRPGATWTVDGDLRYESSTISSGGDVVLEKTLHFVKPRVAITWQARPATQFRVRAEREVGQLNFNDFVASANLNTGAGISAGNPDLDPQQAWVAEAAVEQRFWGGGVIVVTARHFALSDVVDRGPVFIAGAVFDRPTNIGKGTKQELAVDLTLPFDRIGLKGARLKGDAVWRRSEVEDPTTGQDREISGLRPVDWNASFSHDLPRLNLTYGVDAYGGWRERYYRFNAIETTKLKTYVKPFAEWRPVRDINIRFELPNITSRGLRNTRLSYAGTRAAGGQPDIEDRDLQFGRMYSIRVRKRFGA